MQTFSVLLDAYANAFNHDLSMPSPWMSDSTTKPGMRMKPLQSCLLRSCVCVCVSLCRCVVCVV